MITLICLSVEQQGWSLTRQLAIFSKILLSLSHLQCLEAREDKNPLLLESVSSRIEPFKYEEGGGGGCGIRKPWSNLLIIEDLVFSTLLCCLESCFKPFSSDF